MGLEEQAALDRCVVTAEIDQHAALVGEFGGKAEGAEGVAGVGGGGSREAGGAVDGKQGLGCLYGVFGVSAVYHVHILRE